MIRQRIGQAVLRAYPPAIRETRGLEMLGMVLDAGEQSSRAFVRESGSLVLGGLRERARSNAPAGTRRLIADSCCQAVPILLTLWLISALNTQVFAAPTRQLFVQEIVLAAILACAVVGHERIAAVSALAAIAAFSPLGVHTPLVWAAKVLVPIGCLLVMACAPQKRPHDTRQLVWLVPVFVLAALHALAHVSLPELLALISLGGLLRLLYDPRLAIACSLVWILLLTRHPPQPLPAGLGLPMILAAVAAVLSLTVVAGRLWIMRHSHTA